MILEAIQRVHSAPHAMAQSPLVRPMLLPLARPAVRLPRATNQPPPLTQRGAMRRCTQRKETSAALRVFDGHGSLTLKFCAQLPKPSGINNQFAFLTIEKDGEDVLLLKLSTSECRIFIH